jgi:hypothetical protein
MNKPIHGLSLAVLLLIATQGHAQPRYEVGFPDLPGYVTLVCDLHMHTVFSDGEVWPSVRVREAWRQGLDVISVTDHIEYQPHEEDLPTQHQRPYEIAAGPAQQMDLLLLTGTEITRDTPPGHFNAIFTKDIDRLDTDDFLEVIERASQQGAFVFWNHQEWKGPERGRWLDVHTTMYENGWLHGMEVCNGETYYPSAHAWCLEKNLTMLGNSDIHTPDLRQRSAPDDHRTMTLVLARERTPESVREALVEGRTAVWYKNQLIGREQWLRPLFEGALRVHPPHLRGKDAIWVKVSNDCDLDIWLEQRGNVGPGKIHLPARTTSLLKISVPQPREPVELSYTATNFLIAPETFLPVTLKIAGP